MATQKPRLSIRVEQDVMDWIQLHYATPTEAVTKALGVLQSMHGVAQFLHQKFRENHTVEVGLLAMRVNLTYDGLWPILLHAKECKAIRFSSKAVSYSSDANTTLIRKGSAFDTWYAEFAHKV